MSGTAAQAKLETPSAPTGTAPPVLADIPRGQRTLRGLYPASQHGRRAADGSLLDKVDGLYAIASAWRDPACGLLQCWRPDVGRMVPLDRRWCSRHLKLTLPADDPFPLEGAELRAAEARAWERLASSYGVPILYQHALEDALPTPAIQAVRRYFDFDCRAMVLQGGVGCGKSTALYAALRDLALDKARNETDEEIRFFDFPRLSRLLLDDAARDETLESCLEADELLIDDLGAGFVKLGGFVAACMEEIVIHREARRYPILASTNLDPKAFRRMFGPRVYDRLRGAWGHWISVDGPSLRKKPSRTDA